MSEPIRVSAVLEVFIGGMCGIGLAVIALFFLIEFPQFRAFTFGLSCGLAYSLSNRAMQHYRVCVARITRRMRWR